ASSGLGPASPRLAFPPSPRVGAFSAGCATPFSNFSLDYRRSDARIVKNGFAASSGVSKSAKVVLMSTAFCGSAEQCRVADQPRLHCGQYENGPAERPVPARLATGWLRTSGTLDNRYLRSRPARACV